MPSHAIQVRYGLNCSAYSAAAIDRHIKDTNPLASMTIAPGSVVLMRGSTGVALPKATPSLATVIGALTGVWTRIGNEDHGVVFLSDILKREREVARISFNCAVVQQRVATGPRVQRCALANRRSDSNPTGRR